MVVYIVRTRRSLSVCGPYGRADGWTLYHTHMALHKTVKLSMNEWMDGWMDECNNIVLAIISKVIPTPVVSRNFIDGHRKPSNPGPINSHARWGPRPSRCCRFFYQYSKPCRSLRPSLLLRPS